MPRPLRRVSVVVAFAVFAVGTAVISRVLIPRHRRRTRALDDEARRAADEQFLLRCFRWLTRYFRRRGLVRFTPPPLPADLPKGAFVLVANHPSFIDVLHLKSIVPGLRCVVRADLWRRWWLGPLLRFSDDIPGPDGTSASVGETRVLDQFVARLRSGQRVLVFPEGSRSPEAGLRRFRRGAIEAAVQAGVPVVPAVVRVCPPSLNHERGWRDFDPPVDVSIHFLPARATLDAAGQPLDSAALTRELKADYVRALGLEADSPETRREASSIR